MGDWPCEHFQGSEHQPHSNQAEGEASADAGGGERPGAGRTLLVAGWMHWLFLSRKQVKPPCSQAHPLTSAPPLPGWGEVGKAAESMFHISSVLSDHRWNTLGAPG